MDPATTENRAQARAEALAARITVGIITALPKEFAAVKTMLDMPVEHAPPGRAAVDYVLGEVPAKAGKTHAVALVCTGQGNNSAAMRATLLLSHFPGIDAILMIGIAGGAPNPERPDEHVRLGDIVVSDNRGVVQYDFDKATRREGIVEVEHRHPPRPPSARLLEAVRALEVLEYERRYPWVPLLQRAKKLAGSARPVERDELRDSLDPNIVLTHPYDYRRSVRRPRVFKGPIASANKLLNDPRKRDALRDRFGVKAIEMEASGVADASWQHEVGYQYAAPAEGIHRTRGGTAGGRQRAAPEPAGDGDAGRSRIGLRARGRGQDRARARICAPAPRRASRRRLLGTRGGSAHSTDGAAGRGPPSNWSSRRPPDPR